MAHVTYEIVQHDNGWAYRVDGTFSMTYTTRQAAHAAAQAAAQEQHASGDSAAISYETSDGKWHEEQSRGDDRPETDVKD